MNSKDPDSFFAKISWRKLYERNPIYAKLVVKFEVRNQISEKIGSG